MRAWGDLFCQSSETARSRRVSAGAVRSGLLKYVATSPMRAAGEAARWMRDSSCSTAAGDDAGIPREMGGCTAAAPPCAGEVEGRRSRPRLHIEARRTALGLNDGFRDRVRAMTVARGSPGALANPV